MNSKLDMITKQSHCLNCNTFIITNSKISKAILLSLASTYLILSDLLEISDEYSELKLVVLQVVDFVIYSVLSYYIEHKHSSKSILTNA